MRSPFKLLDAYTLKDRDVFFGRTDEIATLYELVNKNRLILVYGESGTGKTSLVQCGLASHFDATDWYPIFIRRRDNINESLQQALVRAAGENGQESLVEMVDEIYANYLRPVYLIFDQLEELLILGEAKERQDFIENINDIYRANLPCRILFILRKEYLANLYDFEKVIPALFDRRLMVEPMSYAKVEEVITKSCERFNIKLEQPAINTQQIIDNISAGKSGIPLPYLQVYMDMLYREDLAQTYQQEPEETLPPLEFTTEEIETFGKIDNVLKKFLQEQQTALQQEIEKKFPQIPSNTIQQILDAFVTEEGTKRALVYDMDGEIVLLDTHAPDFLRKLPAPVLTYCLQALEKRRILRATEQTYELAHDSLAALIDQGRSDEQRQLNDAKNDIKNWTLIFNRFKTYATEDQLLSVDKYLSKLELSIEQIQFLQDSRHYINDRKNQQLEEQRAKLEAERTRRRRATVYAVVGFVLAGVAIIASLWALQSQKATEQALTATQEANKKVETERDRAEQAQKEAETERDRAQTALARFQEEEAAKVLANVKNILSRAERLRASYPQVYRDMLNEAKNELRKYPDNPILAKRLQELN